MCNFQINNSFPFHQSLALRDVFPLAAGISNLAGGRGGKEPPETERGILSVIIYRELPPPLLCNNRRKLIKVEAVTQSYLWALSVSTREPLIEQIVTRGRQLTKAVLWAFSLSIVDLFLFPFLDFVTNTQFQRLSFPNCGNDEYRISRASPLLC